MIDQDDLLLLLLQMLPMMPVMPSYSFPPSQLLFVSLCVQQLSVQCLARGGWRTDLVEIQFSGSTSFSARARALLLDTSLLLALPILHMT